MIRRGVASNVLQSRGARFFIRQGPAVYPPILSILIILLLSQQDIIMSKQRSESVKSFKSAESEDEADTSTRKRAREFSGSQEPFSGGSGNVQAVGGSTNPSHTTGYEPNAGHVTYPATQPPPPYGTIPGYNPYTHPGYVQYDPTIGRIVAYPPYLGGGMQFGHPMPVPSAPPQQNFDSAASAGPATFYDAMEQAFGSASFVGGPGANTSGATFGASPVAASHVDTKTAAAPAGAAPVAHVDTKTAAAPAGAAPVAHARTTTAAAPTGAAPVADANMNTQLLEILAANTRAMEKFAVAAAANAQSSSNESTSKRDRDLTGQQHAVNIPSLSKLSFSGSIARDVQALMAWQWKLVSYLRQRTKHGEAIYAAITDFVEHTMQIRNACTDAASKEAVCVNIGSFRQSLSNGEREHYDVLCTELAPLFPQHVQTFASSLAKQRGGGVELIDYFFLVGIDMQPFDSTEFASIRRQYTRFSGEGGSLTRPKTTTVVSWLLAWRSNLVLLEKNRYIDSNDDYTDFYTSLDSAISGLLPADGRITLRIWRSSHPLPARFMPQTYLLEFYSVLLGIAREFFRGSASTEVNLLAGDTPKPGTGGGQTVTPIAANDTGGKPPKGGGQPSGGGGGGGKSSDNTEKPVKPDKTVKPPKGGGTPSGGGGGGAKVADKPPDDVNALTAPIKGNAGGGKPTSDVKCPRIPRDFNDLPEEKRKQHWRDVKTYFDHVKLPAICRSFFLAKRCDCYNILSHKEADWKAFADHAKSHVCKKGVDCRFRDQEPPLKCCPYIHKAKEVHFMSNVFVSTVEPHRTFLLDFCASTNVSGSQPLASVDGTEVVRTIHGTDTHTRGQIDLPSGKSDAIHIDGAQDILSGNTFMHENTNVDAVTYAKTGGNIYVPPGWSITTKSGTIPLSTNAHGFPVLDNTTLQKCTDTHVTPDDANTDTHAKHDDDDPGAVTAVNSLQQVGQWREWDELPERSTRVILKALRKSTFVSGTTDSDVPTHFWASSSGFGVPMASEGNLVFDVELDSGFNVLLVTPIDLDRQEQGPAYWVDKYKNRVFRVLYSIRKSTTAGISSMQSRAKVAFVMAVSSVAYMFGGDVELNSINLNEVIPHASDVHAIHDADVFVEHADTLFGAPDVLDELADTYPDDFDLLDALDDIFDAADADARDADDGGEDVIDPRGAYVDSSSSSSDDVDNPQTSRRLRRSRKNATHRHFTAVLNAVSRKYPHLSKTEKHKIAHASCGHYPSDPACLECCQANQSRLPHSHKTKDRQLRDRVHFDTTGNVKPQSYRKHKFAFCGIDEKTGFKYVKTAPRKSSSLALTAFKQCCKRLDRIPHVLYSANDTEYRGKVDEYIESLPPYTVREGDIDVLKPITHERAPRYSPWRNGRAEKNIRELERAATTALVSAHAPASLWDLALEYAADIQNITSGAWEAVYGSTFPANKMGPFGCMVTIVRESPSAHKFAPRADTGFLIGFVKPDLVRVAFKTGGQDEGENTSFKLTIIESQNARPHCTDMFDFGLDASEVPMFEPAEADDDENDLWVLVTCCGKWREIHEGSIVNDGDSYTCSDLDMSCDDEQDPAANRNVLDVNVIEKSFVHDVYKFESVSKRVAFSDEVFRDTTYNKIMQPALQKEQASFDEHGSFDYDSHMSLRQFRERYPGGVILLMNLIMGIKNSESLTDAKGKARLVVFKELRASNMAPTSGIAEDEYLTTCNAGPASIRTFIAVMTGNEKVLKVTDWTGAYQTAKNLDKCAVGALLPPEMYRNSPGWEVYTKDNPCVCLVLKSLYGRKRAGFDFNSFAQDSLCSLGWNPLHDILECLYVRPPPPTDTTGKPDGALRYTDDALIGAADPDPYFVETGKVFIQPEITFLSGTKFVGVHITVKELDEFRREIRFNQTELIEQTILEFEEDLETYTTGRKLRLRHTPAKATDTHVPRTREQDAAHAAAEADLPPPKPGVLADLAPKYNGSNAYVERNTRPDVTVALHQCQQATSRWSTDDDDALIWLMGYLKQTANDSLTGVVDIRDFRNNNLTLVTQTDASHAGDKYTRLGTAGFAIYLVGPGTNILLDWGSKKLPHISLSSCESEVFGGQFGSKKGIYIKLLVDALSGFIPVVIPRFGEYSVDDDVEGVNERLEMDAMAAIGAIRNLNTVKMNYLRRTLGVSIAWMHRKWCNKTKSELAHRNGKALSADALTKNLSRDPLEVMKELLGIQQ